MTERGDVCGGSRTSVVSVRIGIAMMMMMSQNEVGPRVRRDGRVAQARRETKCSGLTTAVWVWLLILCETSTETSGLVRSQGR